MKWIPTGEIVYINAAGIPLVFLNDFKTYNDLLHNRGDIYSDKPRMVMTGELCGAEYMVRPLSIETTPIADTLPSHRCRSRERATE